MKKKFILLFIFLLIFFPAISNAEEYISDTIKVYKVDKSKKVYDFANLLSDQEEQELYEKSQEFIKNNKMDIVLLTINVNPYGSADSATKRYSEDFYDYNNFGVGKTMDGIIIIIDMNNRYPYITTTGNAQLVYDDNRIETMHNLAYSYLASGKYYSALNSYLRSANSFAEKDIPDSNKNYCIDDDGEYYRCTKRSVNWIWAGVISGVATLIILVVTLGKYKGIRKATNAGIYLTNKKITNSKDMFLTTFTSRVRRSHSSSSGSSGGGGSSISHGSSGRSHGGGGGRHF